MNLYNNYRSVALQQLHMIDGSESMDKWIKKPSSKELGHLSLKSEPVGHHMHKCGTYESLQG